MQKISSYLYPNRINVIADLAAFPVRWNIVYQNRIKIYQGVDNVLTVDVKNAEQKRIDISNMNLEMCVMDVNGQLLTAVPLVNMQTQGLATATVAATELVHLSPQFLKFTIYKINNDNTKTLLYADTQFGALGNMELVGSAVPVESEPRYITRWLDSMNDRIHTPWITTWYSDAVEIKKPNFLTSATLDRLDFEFAFRGLAATVTVQFTKDPIVGAGITWVDVDTFTVDPQTANLTRTYTNGTYNREWTWARVNYVRATNNTGKIDKITVQL